jgi:putative mRNA 3-end processing factor
MINTITLDSFEFGGMRIKQFNSGHIIGSTSLLVETKNKKIFYTGDICDKHRFHIEGARVPRSDIMIIESTYGNPYYILPNIHEIVEWSRKWTKESLENNNSVILTGYALGKAQVLTKLIDDFDYPIIIHDSIHKINEICRKFGFDYSKIIPYSTAGNIIKNEKFIGIFPSSSMYLRLIKKLKTKFETKIATFSGWSLNPLYKHQLGVDEAFPLSDHSDFNGLLKIIKESNPEKVYTTHGFAADLAHQIKARLGIDAEAIMEERNNLKDFIS